MNADISLLYSSPSVQIFDFRCKEVPGSRSGVEHCSRFEIDYTRTGRFRTHSRHHNFDVDNSVVLLRRPGSEYRISHEEEVHDQCTSFQFHPELLEEAGLLRNATPDSAAVTSSPALDYLHANLFQLLNHREISLLKTDILAIRFLKEIGRIANAEPLPSNKLQLHARYLPAIERAKSYILENLEKNLSLRQIARAAYISEFHFSRIFRAITSRSPHQFLLEVRFNHALSLLRDTPLSMTEICYASGFSNFSHFITAFRQRFHLSPLQFRKRNQ